MDHKEIDTIVNKFIFAHKEVQGKCGEIISAWINLRVFFLVDDLEIGMANRTCLGLDNVGLAFEAVIGDAFGSVAIAALGSDHMPF